MVKYDNVAAVLRTVRGAHLPEGTERTPSAIGYSVGALAQVMQAWREQPHRGWSKRELARAAEISESTVGYVMRDLQSVGHAERRDPQRPLYARPAYRWVLTPSGREAWAEVPLDARAPEQPPHRKARPQTPRLT